MTKKRKEQIIKLLLESQRFSSGYFLTLTIKDLEYYNQFVESTKYTSYELKKFVTALKYRVPDLSYFIISEYGTKTNRLHFHAIMFTNKITDRIEFCKLIEHYWPYGFVFVGKSGLASIKYTTKYVLKNKFFQYKYQSSRPPLGFITLLDDIKLLYKSFSSNYLYYERQSFRFPKSYYQFTERISQRVFKLFDFAGFQSLKRFLSDLSFTKSLSSRQYYNLVLFIYFIISFCVQSEGQINENGAFEQRITLLPFTFPTYEFFLNYLDNSNDIVNLDKFVDTYIFSNNKIPRYSFTPQEVTYRQMVARSYVGDYDSSLDTF